MPAHSHPATSPDPVATVGRAITAHAHEPGGLLPLLHAIQDELGWLPPEALPRVADVMNLSRAEVHGVVSFYHDFRLKPPGRRVVRICRAESCQAMGSDALVEHARQRLGMEMHSTRPDGGFTLEPVYCLGNCALSPSMTVDGTLHGRVDPARFDEVIDEMSPLPEASRSEASTAEAEKPL